LAKASSFRCSPQVREGALESRFDAGAENDKNESFLQIELKIKKIYIF
jgi:hypothetical protein